MLNYCITLAVLFNLIAIIDLLETKIMAEPYFTLNDGARIPFLAFGTGTALYNTDVTETVGAAISKGIVHFDGAQSYENEDSLGGAIAASRKPRDSFYVTTKLIKVPNGQTPKGLLLQSLTKLKMDYVDLLLIHTVRVDYGKDYKRLQEVWKGMEDVKQAGLAKSIGISNAGVPEIEVILKTATIVPAVNQIEFHPYFFKVGGPIDEFNKKHGILTASYSGLTPIARARGGPLEPILASIRERLNKVSSSAVTEAHVLGKWLLQKGIVFVTTTSREERLEEYLGVSGTPDLTDEEIKTIEVVGSKHFVQVWGMAFPL